MVVKKYLQAFSYVFCLFILFGTLFTLKVSAFESFGYFWDETYGGANQDHAYSIAQTNDGGYAIVGCTWSYGVGNSDAWLVKTDSAGVKLWSKTYGTSKRDGAYHVVQTSDGGYALSGFTGGAPNEWADAWLVKTDADGNMEWEHTYPMSGSGSAYCVIQTSDGGYILVGGIIYWAFGGTCSDPFWIKTDASGDVEWSKFSRRHGPGPVIYSVIQTSDGGYAMTGWGGGSFLLIKVNTIGDEDWRQYFWRGWWTDSEGFSVIQTDDGGYILAGRTTDIEWLFWRKTWGWLVRTDSEGNELWNRMYGAPDSHLRSILQTPDGGFVVAGFTNAKGHGGNDAWLMKLDNNGNMEGEDQVFGGSHNDIVKSLVETFDGGYAMAGSSESKGAGGEDFWLLVVGPSLEVTVSPSSAAIMDYESQIFGSSVSGGTLPYSYQWYLNETAVVSAENSSWVFDPPSPGYYEVYLKVTDSRGKWAKSNVVSIMVNSSLCVAISPPYTVMDVGQSKLFSSNVSGGTPPYSYQWYKNDTLIMGATMSDWLFTPVSMGIYIIHLGVTDNEGAQARSNEAVATVNPAMNVSVTPETAALYTGQSLEYTCTVSGGTSPYIYSWYVNGTEIVGENTNSWFFTPSVAGNYSIYAKATDDVNAIVQSNIASATVTTRDVAVVNVTPGFHWLYKGKLCGANVNVTVANEGSVVETFNVTVYADSNTTAIGDEYIVGIQPVTLIKGNLTTLTFIWNTTDVTPCCNYTITAVADSVPFENDTADNTLSSTIIVYVRFMGDINADNTVDMQDISVAAKAFGSDPTRPRWDSRVDINQDNKIDIWDIALIARNFGKTYP